MGRIVGRGNREMAEIVISGGNAILRDMYIHRQNNEFVVFRVCEPQEAIDTWFYCLAGGRPNFDLKKMTPSESEVVQQVGNNEGIKRVGPDPRLARLQKLGLANNTSHERSNTRNVVEFSEVPALQFGSNYVKVGVNKDFRRKGSNLLSEGGGGWVLQVGTPLAWVEMDETLTRSVCPTRKFVL